MNYLQQKIPVMKMTIYNFILVPAAALLILAGGCKKSNNGVTSLYVPTSADVTSTATLDELTQGRALYINNCASCHDLYSPDDFTATQWKNIMGSMSMKTGMMSSQNTLVSKYVSRGK
jgi:hypothetical protein